MKYLALLLLLAAGVVRAAPLDVTNAPFDHLLLVIANPGSGPDAQASRAAAQARIEQLGPVALSNLMERIHIENATIGVLATSMVKDKPLPRDQAVPVLAHFLGAPRETTRKMAAFYLSFYFAPELTDRVLPLLNAPKTRGAAIRALGRWHAVTALPRIAEALRDPQERVRVTAANALREMGDPAGIAPLIAALADPCFTVRNTAGSALTKFRAAAVTPLTDALQASKDLTQRRQIVRVLGDIGDKDSVRFLRPLLEDADADMRRDAARSIALINDLRGDRWFAIGGG